MDKKAAVQATVYLIVLAIIIGAIVAVCVYASDSMPFVILGVLVASIWSCAYNDAKAQNNCTSEHDYRDY